MIILLWLNFIQGSGRHDIMIFPLSRWPRGRSAKDTWTQQMVLLYIISWEKCSNFIMRSLFSFSVFVLDTGFHVFVWVGKDATSHEKGGGLMLAHVSVILIECSDFFFALWTWNNESISWIALMRTRASSRNMGKIGSFQVQLARKRKAFIISYDTHCYCTHNVVCCIHNIVTHFQEYVKKHKEHSFLPVTRVAQGQHNLQFEAAFDDNAPVSFVG